MQACPVSIPLKKGGAQLTIRDRIYHDRQDIDDMFQNARLYFCGAKKVAIGVEEVMRKMYRERTGNGEDEAMEWYKQIQADRFATDVFG